MDMVCKRYWGGVAQQHALHSESPQFNPKHLQAGLGKTHARNCGELLSVSADTSKLEDPKIQRRVKS